MQKSIWHKSNPNESYTIKSEVSGVVTFVDSTKEASFINKKCILVKLNVKEELIELEAQKGLLASQKEIVSIKKRNYQAKQKIKQLSQYDKNSEKLSYLESKKELINTQKQIQTLKNTLDKKSFEIDKKYIGSIYVKEEEYVNAGDKIFEMHDISHLKITLYLTKDEIKALSTQSIFINQQKSDFAVAKIHKTKDQTKISRYKVEFVKPNKNQNNFFFDDVVTVEIK